MWCPHAYDSEGLSQTEGCGGNRSFQKNVILKYADKTMQGAFTPWPPRAFGGVVALFADGASPRTRDSFCRGFSPRHTPTQKQMLKMNSSRISRVSFFLVRHSCDTVRGIDQDTPTYILIRIYVNMQNHEHLDG